MWESKVFGKAHHQNVLQSPECVLDGMYLRYLLYISSFVDRTLWQLTNIGNLPFSPAHFLDHSQQPPTQVGFFTNPWQLSSDGHCMGKLGLATS